MGDANKELAKYGKAGQTRQVSNARMKLLEQVQGRIEDYCKGLFRDLQFDRLTAQKAEHAMLKSLAAMDHDKLSTRELRLNAYAMAKFRKRAMDQVIRLADIIRQHQASAKFQTNIQVNMGDQDYTDDELMDALGVLEESGLVPEGMFDGEEEDGEVRGEGLEEEGGEECEGDMR